MAPLERILERSGIERDQHARPVPRMGRHRNRERRSTGPDERLEDRVMETADLRGDDRRPSRSVGGSNTGRGSMSESKAVGPGVAERTRPVYDNESVLGHAGHLSSESVEDLRSKALDFSLPSEDAAAELDDDERPPDRWRPGHRSRPEPTPGPVR